MEKVIKNIPLALLLILFIKGIFLGIDLPLLGVFTVLGGIQSLILLLDKKLEIQDLKLEIDALKKESSDRLLVEAQAAEKVAKDMAELKSHIQSARLNMGYVKR